ncbi:hypothetical protein D3C84_1062300 [compost metagenome]
MPMATAGVLTAALLAWGRATPSSKPVLSSSSRAHRSLMNCCSSLTLPCATSKRAISLKTSSLLVAFKSRLIRCSLISVVIMALSRSREGACWHVVQHGMRTKLTSLLSRRGASHPIGQMCE